MSLSVVRAGKLSARATPVFKRSVCVKLLGNTHPTVSYIESRVMSRNPSRKTLFKPLAVLPKAIDRDCDGCSVCCHIFHIWELDKPMRVWCRHISSAHDSCTEYDSRPTSCREFLCHWRLETALVPECFKPSVCGFIITYSRQQRAFLVHETREGAFDDAVLELMDWVHRLRRRGAKVGLVPFDVDGSPREDMFLFDPMPRATPDLTPMQTLQLLPSSLIASGMKAVPRGDS